jgi:RecJ-like exonuclease
MNTQTHLPFNQEDDEYPEYCDECEGTGVVKYSETPGQDEYCPECDGSGIVEWDETDPNHPRFPDDEEDGQELCNCPLCVPAMED